MMLPSVIFLGAEVIPQPISLLASWKVRSVKNFWQLDAISRSAGVSVGAFRSVYEQSPSASRRMTNHSARGC